MKNGTWKSVEGAWMRRGRGKEGREEICEGVSTMFSHGVRSCIAQSRTAS